MRFGSQVPTILAIGSTDYWFCNYLRQWHLPPAGSLVLVKEWCWSHNAIQDQWPSGGKASASLGHMSHCAIFLPWVFSVVSGNLSGNCICKAGVQAENVSGVNYFKANYSSLQEVHSLKLQSWWNYTYFKGLRTSLRSSGMHSSFRWSLYYLPLLPTQFCPKLLVEKKSKNMSQMLSKSDFHNTGRCQTGFASHPTSHICLPQTHSSRSN